MTTLDPDPAVVAPVQAVTTAGLAASFTVNAATHLVIVGALLLPALRERFALDRLASAGAALTMIALVFLGIADRVATALGATLLGGAGWITALTCFDVSAQITLPDWVRARGLAVYLTVFFGAMAAGATGWGQLASATSVTTALLTAAAALLGGMVLTRGARLGRGEALDLSPSACWPAPTVARPGRAVVGDRGPVLVTLAWRIDPSDEAPFLATVHDLAASRYRQGATQWDVFEDTARPGAWLEWFLLPSWVEHLRQHERVTCKDEAIEGRVRACHRGANGPAVNHLPAPATRSP